MKIKSSILFFLFICPIILNCSNDPVTPDGTEYFPLKTGNYWIYGLETDSYKIEITGTKILEGEEYFIFKSSSLPDYENEYERLYRQKEDQIYTYFENEEYVYLDFNLVDGGSWESIGPYKGEVTKKDETVAIDAGRFNDCITVLFKVLYASDLEYSEKYAPDIGLIEHRFRGQVIYRLRSAYINGQTYPLND